MMGTWGLVLGFVVEIFTVRLYFTQKLSLLIFGEKLEGLVVAGPSWLLEL